MSCEGLEEFIGLLDEEEKAKHIIKEARMWEHRLKAWKEDGKIIKYKRNKLPFMEGLWIIEVVFAWHDVEMG